MRKFNASQRTLHGSLSRRRFSAGALALGAAATGASGAWAQNGEMPVAIQDLDTVNGTFPITDEPVTLRVLCVVNPRVEDIATNTFTQWYEEKTNVHVEWMVAPQQEALTSLNVRLASGDYPDVIMNFNLDPALQLLYGSQGVFLPLNDLIDEYGVETRRIFEEMPLARTVSEAPDGMIYSLPTIAGCYHCQYPSKLWIYQPWLDALGLDMPTTTDEFADVLRAFKDGDPNGNGKADEIPLLGANTGAEPLDSFFMNSFIFDPGDKRLILQEGAVTAIYTTEAWRQGMSYLAGLYAEGLIGQETFTQDADQLRRVTNNPDDVVVGAVPALAPSGFMDLGGDRWRGYVSVPPLEGPDGVRLTYHDPYQPFVPGSFVITSACERPDVAFRWADGMFDLETSMRSVEGIPGEDWRWAEPDEIGNNGEPAVWERLYTYGDVQNTMWSQVGLYYRPERIHSGQVAPQDEAAATQPTILYRETAENYVPYAQPDDWVLPPLYFTEEQAQQVADLETSIITYVDESFARAITGQMNLEMDWESYLANLDSVGIAQYLQLYQDAYDALGG